MSQTRATTAAQQATPALVSPPAALRAQHKLYAKAVKKIQEEARQFDESFLDLRRATALLNLLDAHRAALARVTNRIMSHPELREDQLEEATTICFDVDEMASLTAAELQSLVSSRSATPAGANMGVTEVHSNSGWRTRDLYMYIKVTVIKNIWRILAGRWCHHRLRAWWTPVKQRRARIFLV